MVIYDFCCGNGHTFEGWFASLQECTRQMDEGMVRCPLCDTIEVSRQPAAPAVHVRKEPRRSAARPPMAVTEAGRQTALRAFTTAVRQVIQASCEDVGSRFTDEAVAIHDGIADQRNIVGTATAEEEETLVELGVAYQKVTLPRFDD